MPNQDQVTLTVNDFELDSEGNIRIKLGERAEQLLRLLVQARTGAQPKTTTPPPGPKVKVEM
jgi:hypothetical protein